MSASSEMQIRRAPGSRPINQSGTSSQLSSSGASNSSTNSDRRKTESLLYSEAAVRFNENSLEQCRTSVSVLSGCVAGIIGLTSYKGFIFYAFSMFLLSVLIFIFIRNEHRKFFTGLKHVFVNGFLNGLLTYVLFWTFLYGIVHVY